MKISIITATYNSSKTINDCLQSVASQTYSPIEHLIIDGVSEDDTLQKIKDFKGKNISLVSEPDKGIYDAMNKGIQMAKGDVIGILNSDDYYTDDQVVSDIVNLFENENIDAVYADIDLVDPVNKQKIIRKWRSGPFNPNKFLWGWMPPHPTLFIKSKIYEKYGAFDLSFKTSADYELMLRLLYKHCIKVAYLPRVIIKMRTGGFSDSSIRHRLFANKEDKFAWKKNGLKPFIFTTYLKPIRKLVQYF